VIQKDRPRNLTNDEWKAEMAFQVWSVLRREARENPLLLHNSYFDALLDEVDTDVRIAFARLV